MHLPIYIKRNLCLCHNIRIRIFLQEGADNQFYYHMNLYSPTRYLITILSTTREQGYQRRQWKWAMEPLHHTLGKSKVKSDNLEWQNSP